MLKWSQEFLREALTTLLKFIAIVCFSKGDNQIDFFFFFFYYELSHCYLFCRFIVQLSSHFAIVISYLDSWEYRSFFAKGILAVLGFNAFIPIRITTAIRYQ